MASKQDDNWERDVLEKLATDTLVERRRARRWGIFFKLLTFAYLTLLLLSILAGLDGTTTVRTKPHTALVDLDGVIAVGEKASADLIVSGLRAAFEDSHTKGVILRINSPGGSPVQSSYINQEIRRLRGENPDIPLYAVVEDMCASGGYYVAVAADKIYVNESSIVGSIGVLSSSFGFVEAMDNLGIERRLYTAGENKAFMDPFSPQEKADTEHLQHLLGQIHQQFIQVVKEGRGERLSDNPDLFSGLFWTGEESIRLGLADDLGSASQVARDVIGVEDIVDFTPEEDVLERLAKQIGAGAAQAMSAVLGINSQPAKLR
jgi:protease-4